MILYKIMKVDKTGKITIPKEMRKQMNIQPGDHVSLLADGEGQITMRKFIVEEKNKKGE